MVKSSYGGQSEADRLRLLQSLGQIRRETPEVTHVVISPRDAALLSDDMSLEEVIAAAEAFLPTCHNRMPDGICKGHPHSSSPTGVVYHEAAGPPACQHRDVMIFRTCSSCGTVLEIEE